MKVINGDPDDYTSEHSMFDILSEQLAKNGGREVARLEQSDSGECSLTYLHEDEKSLGAASKPVQDIAAMQARIVELERQVKHLEAELAATRKQLVYEINVDDVPSFRDGVLIPHELEDVVDAERCRSLASIITGLRKQLAEVDGSGMGRKRQSTPHWQNRGE